MGSKLILLACFLLFATVHIDGQRPRRPRRPRPRPGRLTTTTAPVLPAEPGIAGGYPIVDTGVSKCYNNIQEATCPAAGQPFFGQDAQYPGLQPKYQSNGDGTVTDLNTGLMWQADPGDKMSQANALAGASTFSLGAYTDWRVPTVKEMYSLINFNGKQGSAAATSVPYIDTNYFTLKYGPGSTQVGQRLIDCQALTSSTYVSTTMNNDATLFGVNFADGRIKGYPIFNRKNRVDNTFYCYYVRGNTNYGKNLFTDNGDGTVSDTATGLMWTQVDSGHLKAGESEDGKVNWEQALAWVEGVTYAGYSDWRLPNAKELQGIVDYSRSPATTNSAAIDPVFQATQIQDEEGNPDYPWYWASTTHLESGPGQPGGHMGVYVTFGKALGWMNFRGQGYKLYDVHGAGAQRSDPKSGDPAQYPHGHGPQGDVIRIYNFARLVRNASLL